MALLLALLIGVAAGLRTMTPLAAIAWGAQSGILPVQGTWLGILAWRWTPWVMTLLAAAEFVTDQLPSTPSRTVPVQFGARIVSGAVCGAALALPNWPLGVALGAVGAVVGTLGGARARAALARAFDRDRPAALIEDAVAIAGAALIVLAAR